MWHLKWSFLKQIFNGFELFTTYTKFSFYEVRQGSECASEFDEWVASCQQKSYNVVYLES